jgi:hypothetical protein
VAFAGRGAGGIASGALTSAPAFSAAHSSQHTPFALTQAATRAQAEAALARDDIPPAMRRYLRDYFLRLQTPRGAR